MLQAVEAEIDVDGNARQVSELLKSPEFANRKSYSAEEIEAQINEARNSWE